MLAIYNKMKQLAELNQRVGKIQNTIVCDEYNNLITSPSPLYLTSCNTLDYIKEMTETYVYLNDLNLRESILEAFTEDMKGYVAYLVENQEDISLQDEIIALTLDFPETLEMFKEKEE